MAVLARGVTQTSTQTGGGCELPGDVIAHRVPTVELTIRCVSALTHLHLFGLTASTYFTEPIHLCLLLTVC